MVPNFELASFFLSVGALTELILLQHPSPGQRFGVVVGVLVGAALGLVVPLSWSTAVAVGFVLARISRISGALAGAAADRVRMRRALRHDFTEADRPESTGTERTDRPSPSGGQEGAAPGAGRE